MDRLKLAALGERLKTGGAQMSRKVSGKMKEILQGQTPEAKMVDEATSDSLEEPNWGINLRICGLLNGEELSGSEVVKAIKKKISSNNTVSVRLSLDLLETCAMNCDKVFSEIASEKVLDEMVRMIENPQTHYSNRQRALQLIQAWGESSDELGYLPVFHQTYLSLKARGLPFSAQDDENLAPVYSSMEPVVDRQPSSLSERDPSFNMDQHAADQNAFASHGGILLQAEERKEILVVTRNSIDLLATLSNSETQQNPAEYDDLVSSMIEKCKQSQPMIQRIIESAGDDEEILFEALNLHEELEGVLSKYVEHDGALVQPEGLLPETSRTSFGSSGHDKTKTEAETETEMDKETEIDKRAEKLNPPSCKRSEIG